MRSIGRKWWGLGRQGPDDMLFGGLTTPPALRCVPDAAPNMHTLLTLHLHNSSSSPSASPSSSPSPSFALPQIAWVKGRCLVDHAPSPQMCARRGRIWDDRDAASNEATGGKCISEMRAKVFRAQPGVEEVVVKVRHDTSECGVRVLFLQADLGV